MKKSIPAVLMTGLMLVGCANKSSDLTPIPSTGPTTPVIETTKTSEPSTYEPTTPAAEPTTPAPEASTPEAGTPATEFAERWGKRYPSIPEYAILKAANGVCTFIEQYGNGWENDPLAQRGIQEAVGFTGIADNSALEFAQDADQNYCASRVNPT